MEWRRQAAARLCSWVAKVCGAGGWLLNPQVASGGPAVWLGLHGFGAVSALCSAEKPGALMSIWRCHRHSTSIMQTVASDASCKAIIQVARLSDFTPTRCRTLSPVAQQVNRLLQEQCRAQPGCVPCQSG